MQELKDLTLTGALKEVKALRIKSDDIRKKISSISARMENQTPEYADEAGQIRSWLDMHHDIITEIERIELAIIMTNINTKVTITIDNKNVTKSISGWIKRRDELSLKEVEAWKVLTDRGLRAKALDRVDVKSDTNNQFVKVIFNYNPKERDEKIALYMSEKTIIDTTLETVNATTKIMKTYPDGSII